MPNIKVATRKGLFFLTLTATDWTSSPPAFAGEPVTAILTDPSDGTIYAALRLGHFGCKLHRSDDGGATWRELPAPVYPADTGASLDMIWALAAGGEPGEIWAGTLPGGLFHSLDRGETWTLNTSLWNRPERADWTGGGYDHPGIHSILVDPRDPNRLTLGVSCGGVWKTDDRGATWRPAGIGLRNAYMPPDLAYDPVTQDPHLLSACASHPDVIWCQHHNGIFRSTDAAETFTEIQPAPPSGFGFAVAAHPADPATAWFVPAVKDECRIPKDGRFVVTRTRDAGMTFETLSEGLPGRPSYDLVYRHALVTNPSGGELVMGSTTGNLWIGAEGGASWRKITSNLPPIAQVTF